MSHIAQANQEQTAQDNPVKTVQNPISPEEFGQDALTYVRALPEDIMQGLGVLLVNRQGTDSNAYMRTENIIGHAEHGKLYQLGWQGLTEIEDDGQEIQLPEAEEPPHAVLTGQWQQEVDLTTEDANILGGMGTYYLRNDDTGIQIPVAKCSPENLAYYDSQLVKVGETTRFDSTGNLPITITAVGKTYAQNYLMDPVKGGGTYLEVHDRPHFHMPVEEDAAGYLILGKQDKDGADRVSAFQIPYGYAVHMAPWAIHSDAYLTGRYLVIYSATPEFSTVIIRQQNGDLGNIEFV